MIFYDNLQDNIRIFDETLSKRNDCNEDNLLRLILLRNLDRKTSQTMDEKKVNRIRYRFKETQKNTKPAKSPHANKKNFDKRKMCFQPESPLCEDAVHNPTQNTTMAQQDSIPIGKLRAITKNIEKFDKLVDSAYTAIDMEFTRDSRSLLIDMESTRDSHPLVFDMESTRDSHPLVIDMESTRNSNSLVVDTKSTRNSPSLVFNMESSRDSHPLMIDQVLEDPNKQSIAMQPKVSQHFSVSIQEDIPKVSFPEPEVCCLEIEPDVSHSPKDLSRVHESQDLWEKYSNSICLTNPLIPEESCQLNKFVPEIPNQRENLVPKVPRKLNMPVPEFTRQLYLSAEEISCQLNRSVPKVPRQMNVLVSKVPNQPEKSAAEFPCQLNKSDPEVPQQLNVLFPKVSLLLNRLDAQDPRQLNKPVPGVPRQVNKLVSKAPEQLNRLVPKVPYQLNNLAAEFPCQLNMSATAVPCPSNMSATAVPCPSNMSATAVPHQPNMSATAVPSQSNMSATEVPHQPNMSATAVPPQSNMSATAVPHQPNMSAIEVPRRMNMSIPEHPHRANFAVNKVPCPVPDLYRQLYFTASEVSRQPIEICRPKVLYQTTDNVPLMQPDGSIFQQRCDIESARTRYFHPSEQNYDHDHPNHSGIDMPHFNRIDTTDIHRGYIYSTLRFFRKIYVYLTRGFQPNSSIANLIIIMFLFFLFVSANMVLVTSFMKFYSYF